MSAARTRRLGSRTIVLADDPLDLRERDPAEIIVCGAPATLQTARTLLQHAPTFVALHDAGVGRDGAGIAGLERLDAFHVPAVAVTHDSARVGDADDVFDRGAVLHLNETARAAGLTTGPLAPQLARFAERVGADGRRADDGREATRDGRANG